MHFVRADVFGAWIIDPTPHVDERGHFMRAWCTQEFSEHGIDFVPVQANMAFSRLKGTIRGMHFQIEPDLEAKLVRCTRGSAFDVVLDIRPDSATCNSWSAVELSAQNGRMLYVPAGCAHGCQSLEDSTEIYYLSSCLYSPNSARGVRFDDPAFNIHWPLAATQVSNQDRDWPLIQR